MARMMKRRMTHVELDRSHFENLILTSGTSKRYWVEALVDPCSRIMIDYRLTAYERRELPGPTSPNASSDRPRTAGPDDRR